MLQTTAPPCILSDMCGRYGLANPARLTSSGFLERLAVERMAPDVPEDFPDALAPRYNIAPGTPVLAALDVRSQGTLHRTLALPRWGLVPRWAKEPSVGNRMANARAEGIEGKPAFRDAWAQSHRCILLADVFYEWQASERAGKPWKQPWAIRLASGEPFGIAGLWERWQDRAHPEEPPLVTCTVITTVPNTRMQPIHDRMPVLLTGDALHRWLDRRTSPEDAAALLQPYAADAMEAWPISTRVNSPAHDDADVLEPASPAP